MGYSTEIKIPADEYKQIIAKEKALSVVQDADRLDAIGAIGIARAFTFGGSKKRGLYCAKAIEAISQEQFPGECPEKVSDKDGATLMHFFDKLFHIEAKMKTSKGKQLAGQRQKVMEQFVRDLGEEVSGSESTQQLSCSNSPIVDSAFEFGKKVMEGFDGSHDGSHLKRIWNNAKAIANSMMEDLDESDRLVIDLAAVLHDVDDHKYKKEGQDYLGDFFKVRKSVCCQ